MLEQWAAGDLPGDSRDTRRERGKGDPQAEQTGEPKDKENGGPRDGKTDRGEAGRAGLRQPDRTGRRGQPKPNGRKPAGG